MSNLIPIIIGILAMHEPLPSSGGMLFLRLGSFVFIVGGSIVLSLRREEGTEKKPRTPRAHAHRGKAVGVQDLGASRPIDT